MKYIITGGHSGMGLELSKKLLNEGHEVGLIVRNESRKIDTQKIFREINTVTIFVADLSKRNEIEKVVNEIKSNWDKLDGLFNNAGILTDKLYYSDYGNELQLEVNSISPYLLTKGLLPLLEKGENPFVVNTATSGLNNKKSLDISSFKKPKKFTKLLGSYIDSKLTMVLLMNHLSEEWKNIRFISVDPGAIKTKMTAGNGMPFWLKPIRNLFFKSPKNGAENLYKEAFSKKNQRSGIYISGGKVKDMQVSIRNEELAELMK